MLTTKMVVRILDYLIMFCIVSIGGLAGWEALIKNNLWEGMKLLGVLAAVIIIISLAQFFLLCLPRLDRILKK